MPQPGIVKPLPEKFTIGRDKDCDIAIADDSVSRIHAELTVLENGKLVLTDRESSNGTAVMQSGQPRRIDQAYVAPTDQVQFGSVVLLVSELIQAIQAKASRRHENKGAGALAGKLIRCECGAVKPAGARCRECGQ